MTTDLRPLADRFAAEIESLERELSEIELLITQARVEAQRHEQRRVAMAARAAAIDLGGSIEAAELIDLNGQLVVLAKRAALMEAQVEVLEGKRKALVRFRDAVAGYAGSAEAEDSAAAEVAPGPVTGDHATELPPALSRVVLTAQEDLRREIARAMHDGPAQSLTNIVLQAQILEQIMARDPDRAKGEIKQLVGMVQQTLEATKTFIFDIRPMVLDDLGLVPTLRRAARERGRRSGVAVQFETVGADRRLPVDVESGLFRILDEGLAGFLGNGAERVALQLDWGDALVARLVTGRGPQAARAAADGEPAADPAPETERRRGRRDRDRPDDELPPALAAMVQDRKDAASAAARAATHIELPAATWREIQQRATTIGAEVAQLDDGAQLRLTLPLDDATPAAG
jgi:two-component system sensor histidine kinase DegS